MRFHQPHNRRRANDGFPREDAYHRFNHFGTRNDQAEMNYAAQEAVWRNQPVYVYHHPTFGYYWRKGPPPHTTVSPRSALVGIALPPPAGA